MQLTLISARRAKDCCRRPLLVAFKILVQYPIDLPLLSFIRVYFVQRSTKTPFPLHDFRRHCRLSLSFYCVHQRNLRISTTLSILRKYEQKALCTKIPLSRGMTGKTFTDTEKEKKNNTEQMEPTFQLGLPYGNPVITAKYKDFLTIYRCSVDIFS